jgi:hypothetical protein
LGNLSSAMAARMVASCSSHCEAAVSADGDMFVVVFRLEC